MQISDKSKGLFSRIEELVIDGSIELANMTDAISDDMAEVKYMLGLCKSALPILDEAVKRLGELQNELELEVIAAGGK